MTEALCTAPFAEDHPDGDQWSLLPITQLLGSVLHLSFLKQLRCYCCALIPFWIFFLMQKSYTSALDTGIHEDQRCSPQTSISAFFLDRCKCTSVQVSWEILGQNLSLQTCFISWESYQITYHYKHWQLKYPDQTWEKSEIKRLPYFSKLLLNFKYMPFFWLWDFRTEDVM